LIFFLVFIDQHMYRKFRDCWNVWIQ
jgi:hypothetical protein